MSAVYSTATSSNADTNDTNTTTDTGTAAVCYPVPVHHDLFNKPVWLSCLHQGGV